MTDTKIEPVSLARAFVSDIEIRSDGAGRTVHGIIVPFDRTARVSDGGPAYNEGFRRGAFARTISHRGDKVKLLSQHSSRSNPLGRASLLREDASGLYGEFYISRTNAGDEVLELVKDGALDSFSVGFRPIRYERDVDRTIWRTEVALREASLVTFPSYEDAVVGGVRAFTPENLADLAEMLRDSVDLAVTPETDPATGGTSESLELAGNTDTDPVSDHSARKKTHLHCKSEWSTRDKELRHV